MKITEKQLRNIIKEAINELDWKTYANAAKKQADIDGEYQLSHEKPNRSYKFNLAAANAFNKKYGKKNNYTDDFTSLHATEPTNWRTTELPKLDLNACDDNDDEHGFLCRDFNEKDKPYLVNKNRNGRLKRVKNIPSKALERHPELKQKFKDAEKEMEHYYNGDYDYTPEKGWHLNESVLRKIIKESINNVLNDFDVSAYDELDAELSRLFGEVKVSRFYSGGNRLVIAAKHGTDIKGVIKFAKECGLKFEDYGENGVYAMLTFK